MNVILEKLLQNEHLSDKDRYEIRQIFEVVTVEKKQSILNNFDKIVWAIIKIKKDLYTEQEILLGKALSNIERNIRMAKSSGIKSGTTLSIGTLKQNM